MEQPGGGARRMKQEEREGNGGVPGAEKGGGRVETASRGRGKAGFYTADGRETSEEPRKARNTRKGEGGGDRGP
jgi:hypothetical protein